MENAVSQVIKDEKEGKEKWEELAIRLDIPFHLMIIDIILLEPRLLEHRG